MDGELIELGGIKTSSVMKQFMDEVITLITDANGIITFIHREYTRTLGISAEDAIGKHCLEVIPGSRMHIVAKTGKKEIGVPFRLKNGEYAVINRLPVFEDGKVVGVVCFVLYSLDVITTDEVISVTSHLHDELRQYKTALRKLYNIKYSVDNIICQSPQMKAVIRSIYNISQTKSSVLISGETGTGKELFAHAIHQLSPRGHRPMVTVNCAAIPAELFESELFGYVDGAFTGAKKGGNPGKFELANGGTLILDEIHLLPKHMQPKLLRVLQEREIERIGSRKSSEIDVRIIFITNAKLKKLVDIGEFREDLFYRINIVPIEIPPLRERLDDIPLLAEHFIKKINHNLGLKITGIDPDVLELFKLHNWPGNVRELEHVLEHAANTILSGMLTGECFEGLTERLNASTGQARARKMLSTARRAAEEEKIIEVLSLTKGNIPEACKILDVSRSGLYGKIKKYNIPVDRV